MFSPGWTKQHFVKTCPGNINSASCLQIDRTAAFRWDRSSDKSLQFPHCGKSRDASSFRWRKLRQFIQRSRWQFFYLAGSHGHSIKRIQSRLPLRRRFRFHGVEEILKRGVDPRAFFAFGEWACPVGLVDLPAVQAVVAAVGEVFAFASRGIELVFDVGGEGAGKHLPGVGPVAFAPVPVQFHRRGKVSSACPDCA